MMCSPRSFSWFSTSSDRKKNESIGSLFAPSSFSHPKARSDANRFLTPAMSEDVIDGRSDFGHISRMCSSLSSSCPNMVGATSHAAAIAAATPCDSGNTTTGFLLAMQPSTVLSVPSSPPSTTSTIGSGRVSSIIDDATLDAAIGRLGIPNPDRERPRLSAGVGRSLPRGSPAYSELGREVRRVADELRPLSRLWVLVRVRRRLVRARRPRPRRLHADLHGARARYGGEADRRRRDPAGGLDHPPGGLDGEAGVVERVLVAAVVAHALLEVLAALDLLVVRGLAARAVVVQDKVRVVRVEPKLAHRRRRGLAAAGEAEDAVVVRHLRVLRLERLELLHRARRRDADARHLRVGLAHRLADELHHARLRAARHDPRLRRQRRLPQPAPEHLLELRRDRHARRGAGDRDEHARLGHAPRLKDEVAQVRRPRRRADARPLRRRVLRRREANCAVPPHPREVRVHHLRGF